MGVVEGELLGLLQPVIRNPVLVRASMIDNDGLGVGGGAREDCQEEKRNRHAGMQNSRLYFPHGLLFICKFLPRNFISINSVV